MTTTIFVPISRQEHLAKLFHALEVMQCDAASTNLLTYVDGDAALYALARNYTESSRFAQRLCVQRPHERAPKVFDISNRRQRISQIQNEAKLYLHDSDFIFGLEDDSIPRPDALRKLQRDYVLYPFAGFISGVEIGRWGINHLGAWTVNDVYEPTEIVSVMPDQGTIEVDAAGLFCYLARAETFMGHHFQPWGDELGPDFGFGLALRQTGFKNYVDFGVPVEHIRADGTSLTLQNTTVKQVKIRHDGECWRQEVLT